jgi:environmental stress-induced protein Ves
MHLTRLTPAQYKRMPWKNGGGMTTELLAEPNPNGGGFLWRISIAEVAMSGPFSDFSAYLRTIMLLEGDGFILKCTDADGHPKAGKRLDRPYEPFAFDGAWKTDCSLIDGPIKDFNLMVARDGVRGALIVHKPKRGEILQLDVEHTAILHVLAGAIGGDAQRFATGETLRIDAARPGLISFHADRDAIVAVATIAPN